MQEVGLAQACEALQRGAVVIYPTETCYGLGVDIRQAKALEKLFHLKGRDATKAVSVLLPNLQFLDQVSGQVSQLAQRLAQKFLPGPLTLVLPAAQHLNPRLHGGSDWVGVRISSHPMAQQLVEQFGLPITTTSANPSGQTSAQGVSELQSYFEKEEVYFLNGGDLPPSKGSTVVKVVGEQLELLRAGDLDFEQIKKEEVEK